MKISKNKIAQRTGRHRSTIYRELERNAQYGCYMPGVAHELAKERHPHPDNKIQTNQE